jgi:GTPase SAR1 family protein
MDVTAESNFEGFERAGEHRRRLRKIIADTTLVADGMSAASAPVLLKIDERVASDTFRVMVVGEFKRGKSTLINAMLGGDVLPAYARPATAVLTELRWWAERTAVLHPADDGEPVAVAVADLIKHITIPKGVRQEAGDTGPWKLAEVGWPLDLLRNGVVLIDSPGLNEHPARQAVTLQNLGRADAIVFVQDIQHPVSSEEARFMSAYLDTYDVFFVFNKINLIPADEVEDVKAVALFRTGEHREAQRRDQYYFVNALAALQARISGDDTAWLGSGVAGFMDDLSTFLATERHRAKFIGPAREAGREIRLLRRAIPGQRALIEQTEAELQQRYEEAQAPLRRLQARAQQIRQELDLTQKHVLSVVRAEVTNRLVRMSSEAPEVIAELTPDSELSLRPWRAKAAAEEYAKELARLASAEATSRFKAWQKQELKAVVDPDLDAMARRADELFREFMRDLAKIREGLTGLDPAAGDDLPGLGSDKSLDGADLAGLDFAGGQAIRHLMGQVAAIYGVALVWCFTPFGLIPLIVGVLMANTALLLRAKGQMEQKVRKELGAVFAQKMRDDAPNNAELTAAAFRKVLGTAIGELMSRVDSELKQLRVQVEDALGALNKGEDEVKRRRELLAEWDSVLETSADAVEDLIGDVALA